MTAAVIVVTDPVVLQWLGPRLVWEWAEQRLAEVRGLDLVHVLVASSLRKNMAGECRDGRASLLPDGVVSEADCLRWAWSHLAALADADVVLLVQAALPFVQATRTEECVNRLAGGAGMAITCRHVRVLDVEAACPAVVVRPQPLYGACVVRRAALPDRGDWPRSIDLVPVDAIEALDLRRPADRVIAQALVDNGSV